MGKALPVEAAFFIFERWGWVGGSCRARVAVFFFPCRSRPRRNYTPMGKILHVKPPKSSSMFRGFKFYCKFYAKSHVDLIIIVLSLDYSWEICFTLINTSEFLGSSRINHLLVVVHANGFQYAVFPFTLILWFFFPSTGQILQIGWIPNCWSFRFPFFTASKLRKMPSLRILINIIFCSVWLFPVSHISLLHPSRVYFESTRCVSFV